MTKKKIDNRRDILLLLLYSSGLSDAFNEPVVGRTRLVKMLFLFKEEALPHFRRGTEISEDSFYEFFPWNFGPFSKQVYDDLTFFTLKGFIHTSESQVDTLPESAAEWEMWLSCSSSDLEEQQFVDYSEQEFRLTERGVSFTSELYESLSGSQRRLLHQFKKRMQQASLKSLLRYVYESYPEQIENSQIKEFVLGTKY